jgi:ATP-dependent protease ClpP protease subunit
MAREDASQTSRISPSILDRPQISLVGEIDKFSVEQFLDQLHDAEKQGDDIALEVTTVGGDPEMARRIVLEVETARSRLPNRLLFLGKSVVYSAGVTIMSGFPCRDRWLAGDAMLMIHGRKLDESVEISGPIRASMPMVKALLAQMEIALDLEERGFRRLIEGSDIGLDELMKRALHNWYLTAEDALKRALVAGIYHPGHS